MAAVRTPFRFDVDGPDDAPVLHVHGDADLRAGVALRSCLRELLGGPARAVSVDLHDVGHLCPAAARALASIARQAGARLRLVHPSPTTRSTFAALGLSLTP